MPSFNREHLIAQSIESVQAQTLKEWELLIIDDGSTDNTVQVANAYAAEDARIQVLQRTIQQKGPSSCRNIGINASKAAYCLFLDSDDLLAPDCLRNRVLMAQAKPLLSLHIFQMQFFYEHPGDNKGLFFFANKEDALASTLAQGSPWGISCPLWQTAVLHSLNGFDESLQSWEDWDLHIRAFISGISYAIHPTIDCYCRQGRISLTSQHESAAHLLQRTNLYLKIGKLIESQHLPVMYRKILAGKCLAHCGMLNEKGQTEAAKKAWVEFQKA